MDIEAKKLEVLERETLIKERELELKIREAGKSAWRSPLVVSILAASLAAASSAWIAYYNAEVNRAQHRRAAENARILQMLNADTEQAASNLQFLLDTELVTDPQLRASIQAYLQSREPGQGPSLALPPPTPAENNQLLEVMIEALQSEIEEGVAAVTNLDQNFTLVRFPNQTLFTSGRASLQKDFAEGTLPRVVQALSAYGDAAKRIQRQPGRLIVLAHTDSIQPSPHGPFPSNQALSEARAKTFAAILREQLPKELKVVAEGRGADDPVCADATPECRAQNRRVEILIERVL